MVLTLGRASWEVSDPTHRDGEVRVDVDNENPGNTAVFGSQR